MEFWPNTGIANRSWVANDHLNYLRLCFSLSHLMSGSAPTGSPRRNLTLSPGGSSFENYIYRPETVRRQRRPKRIVHRNSITATAGMGENTQDPIQNVRKAAGYKELVEKCERGAEIHR